MTQKLRSDARDNRDRIVTAARALFAESGLDVGMREIARKAEVGPATLYRRFPSRQDLVAEAFTVEIRSCRETVEDGCADPDAWRGLTSVVTSLVTANVHNRGFTDSFFAADPPDQTISEERRDLLRQLSGLARRAQAQGRLRPDFVVDDLVLVLLAVRGLSTLAPDARAAAARRFAVLAVDGLRAPAPAPATHS
ncbi:transcriptional regulator, tetR family [Sanguibacter keddieii DSM 10542]|uniref:Transcriptional regulator, tetR family n=1 Tax=Sanguibacter keddieii (strain ATCC 51767 / DSM 10542 / NCFB 3025 / ST-74) TaxID=446469 RepID=D1BAZ2_SANKS|nr:TetR/AcrR family transcriptional regulator [Sanguibacter keddieii]ACZ22693.1 transcriptional regulator, tetR family [Sanguibacter keddieii DSM 10542]